MRAWCHRDEKQWAPALEGGRQFCTSPAAPARRHRGRRLKAMGARGGMRSLFRRRTCDPRPPTPWIWREVLGDRNGKEMTVRNGKTDAKRSPFHGVGGCGVRFLDRTRDRLPPRAPSRQARVTWSSRDGSMLRIRRVLGPHTRHQEVPIRTN